jgi:hypothetical protein
MMEGFSEPEANVIQSSQGFSVRVLGRTGLRYTEGGRAIWVDSEVLAKPGAIAFAVASIRFWEGDDPSEVSNRDRVRVADNIARALRACGYEVEVQEPFDWSSVALRPPEERRRDAP